MEVSTPELGPELVFVDLWSPKSMPYQFITVGVEGQPFYYNQDGKCYESGVSNPCYSTIYDYTKILHFAW